jgi:bacillithiol biosynthesis cysteine-adding enzyme BshC
VTTGQQPQLFGGPLLVLYKALSAVELAVELESHTGRPCLAVFWVASDDHDWREVASIGLLDAEESLRQLQLQAPPGWEGRSVGPAPLPDAVLELLDQMSSWMEISDPGRSWLQGLRKSYEPGVSFSEAFVRVLDDWVGDAPIAFLDSADPELRQASEPLFRSVLARPADVEHALVTGREAVAKCGYSPQLSHVEGAAPIFADTEEGRRRLHVTERGARAGSDGPQISLSRESPDEATGTPELSPSAALRPVLESYLLPVAATVLGPGEIGYWAQLPPLFECLDVPMPAIQPRDSWLVIEPRIDRLLDKTGLAPGMLSDGGASAVALVADGGRPEGLDRAISALETSTVDGFLEAETAVKAEAPGLRPALGKASARTQSVIGELRRAVDAWVREREAARIDQIRRVARNLFPGGVPQERTVSPYVYLARHGDDFLAAVRQASRADRAQGSDAAGGGVAGHSGEM